MSGVPRIVHEFGPDARGVPGPFDPGGRATGGPIRLRGVELRGPKVPGNAGERAKGAAELLDTIRPVLRGAGISRLADITGLDLLGVPVTMAIRPNGRVLSNSAGKGLTREQALASAAMEALELYHAEEWTHPVEHATYRDSFRYLNAPSPDRLPLTGWGPFVADWHYGWVRGWDIAEDEEVAIPAAAVRMGDPQSRLEALHAFQVTSNGLASGGNLAEAVHSALLEVIERDAVTCWQHRRDVTGESPPTIGAAGFGSTVVDELVARLADHGAHVLLFDCTIDTAVPVVQAFLYADDGAGRGVFKGFGAHPNPADAAVRAITEAVQARAVRIAGSRDDLFRHRMAQDRSAEQIRVIDRMRREADQGDRRPLESRSAPSFEDDIAAMLALLRAAGLDQVVVVDLSKPFVPANVVKVVVPGMEGYMVEDYRPGYRARTFAVAAETA